MTNESKDLKGKSKVIGINKKSLFPSKEYREAFEIWLAEEKNQDIINLPSEHYLSIVRDEFNNDFHCFFCKKEHPLDAMFFNDWENDLDLSENNSGNLRNFCSASCLDSYQLDQQNIKEEVAKIDIACNDNNGECSSNSSNELVIQNLNTSLQKSKDNLDRQLEKFKQGKELVLTEFNKSVKTGISNATFEYQTSAIGIASTVIDLIPLLSNAYHLGNTIIDGFESSTNKVSDTKALLIEKRINETFSQSIDNVINSVQILLTKSNHELEKNHRMFLKVLDSETEKYSLVITELENSINDKDLIINDKDLIIRVKEESLLDINKEYDKVLLRLDELRVDLEKVKKSQNKQIDWNEVINSSQNKILDTSTLTIEQLKEEIIEKNELIKGMAIASRNLTIDLALLRDENRAFADRVERYERKEVRDLENIAIWEDNKAIWEENKKKLLANLQSHADKYNKLTGETILLENEIDKLELDKFNLEEKLNKLNSDYEKLNKELTKTSIHLTSTKEDLKDIQRLNFESKVKLQGVLFLDSMRTFMPSICGKVLTGIETTIFVSGITNHPNIEKAGWASVALFITFSVLLNVYKASKFTWFKGIDFIDWLRGKKKDLNALKEAELKAWRDKWNISKNYSITDLEEAKSDKDILDISGSESNEEVKKNISNNSKKRKNKSL